MLLRNSAKFKMVAESAITLGCAPLLSGCLSRGTALWPKDLRLGDRSLTSVGTEADCEPTVCGLSSVVCRPDAGSLTGVPITVPGTSESIWGLVAKEWASVLLLLSWCVKLVV